MAQWNEGLILKVKPGNYIFSESIGFEIEKVVSDRMSLSLGYTWKRHDLISVIWPHTVEGNGFKVDGSMRYYFSGKRLAPYGWFFGNIIRYKTFSTTYIPVGDGAPNHPLHKEWSGVAVGSFIGHQFRIWQLTTDFSIGHSLYGRRFQSTHVNTTNPNHIDNFQFVTQFYFSWTIGFNLSSKKKE